MGLLENLLGKVSSMTGIEEDELRSKLGMKGTAPTATNTGTAVTVEREPGPATGAEAAVKEPEPELADGADVETEEAEAEEPEEVEPPEEAEPEAAEPEEAEAEEAEAEAEAEEPEAAEVEGADESVDVLTGIGPAYSERLSDAGIETVGDLANADAAEVAELTDVSEGRVTEWIERARNR